MKISAKNLMPFVVLLWVCSSIGGQQNAKAKIWIYREKSSTDSMLNPMIYSRGKEIAKLEKGQFFTLDVGPGKYYFSWDRDAKPGQEAWLNFTGEQDLYLKVRYREIKPMSAKDAREDLSKLKPIEPKNVVSLSITAAEPASEEQRPIRLIVLGARSADGFVDSGRIEESARDLRDVLSGKKFRYLNLVNSVGDADVAIEVTFSGQRQAGSQSSTQVNRGIFGGITATTNTNATALPSITAVLHVRNSDYQKEFSITQQLFWKDLAERIVGQFDSWMAVNWEPLQKQIREASGKTPELGKEKR